MTAALICSALALLVSVINLCLYFQLQDRGAPPTHWPKEWLDE